MTLNQSPDFSMTRFPYLWKDNLCLPLGAVVRLDLLFIQALGCHDIWLWMLKKCHQLLSLSDALPSLVYSQKELMILRNTSNIKTYALNCHWILLFQHPTNPSYYPRFSVLTESIGTRGSAACYLRFLWTEWRSRFFALPGSLLMLSQQWVLVALIRIWAVPCVLISIVSGDASGGVTPRHLVLPFFFPFSLIPCSPLTTWFCRRRRLTLLLKIVVLWQMLIEKALKAWMHCNGKKITQV